jgi:hypothetical protein
MKTLKRENSQKSSAHKAHAHRKKGMCGKLLYTGNVRLFKGHISICHTIRSGV